MPKKESTYSQVTPGEEAVRRQCDRIILDQVDPEAPVPGGTDTCIFDIIRHGTEEIWLVGVTRNSARPLGVWSPIQLGNKRIMWMPVARLDRSPRKFRLPDSMKLALGIVRFRNRVPSGALLQAHRVEIGAVIRIVWPNSLYCQFIHNDSKGLTGTKSESVWRYLKGLYFAIERFSLAGAIAVVAFTAGDGERLTSFADVHLAKTWYDDEVFYPEAPEEAPLRDSFTVLFVGRLESQKDPILAVEAVADLARVISRVELRIAGSGSLEALVRRRVDELGISHRVSFLGAISRSDVADNMRRADALVLVSHFEGSPRVIAEACACGTPVVATAEADPDGVLTGANGVSVSSRRPSSIAAALAELASNRREVADCTESVATRRVTSSVQEILYTTRLTKAAEDGESR